MHSSFLLVPGLLLWLNSFAYSQEKYPVRTGDTLFSGFDPVSYQAGEPSRGLEVFSLSHEGRIIKFCSPGNLKNFQKDKSRLLPAYGGWCAYSMSEGQFVKANPGNYLLQDGRLFLFSSKAYLNALEKWQKAPDINQIKADQYYYIKYFPEAIRK